MVDADVALDLSVPTAYPLARLLQMSSVFQCKFRHVGNHSITNQYSNNHYRRCAARRFWRQPTFLKKKIERSERRTRHAVFNALVRPGPICFRTHSGTSHEDRKKLGCHECVVGRGGAPGKSGCCADPADRSAPPTPAAPRRPTSCQHRVPLPNPRLSSSSSPTPGQFGSGSKPPGTSAGHRQLGVRLVHPR